MSTAEDNIDAIQRDIDPAPSADEIEPAKDSHLSAVQSVFGDTEQVAGIVRDGFGYPHAIAQRQDGRWVSVDISDAAPSCEECGAVDTEHVDVQQIDDEWYGTASGKVDLCESCRVERIPDLAHECADEADRAAAPGQLEVADPMEGDWQALADFLGREPTDAEREAFADAYRARLSGHVQQRPEVQ